VTVNLLEPAASQAQSSSSGGPWKTNQK
jgi:hypothetical protein